MISFCIPTRNFGAFIGVTLDHLLRERGPQDEIVIVDGNSTDQTASVVQSYQAQHPRIHFHQQASNGGVDRDLALAVSLAKGQYCWLFSADDGLSTGAVEIVRSALASEPAALLMERIDCNFELLPQRARRWLSTGATLRHYRLADSRSLRQYFTAVRSLGGMFSYISSIVVQRDYWLEVNLDNSFLGSHYAHVGRLFTLLQQPQRELAVLSKPLVLCRGDNDSFAQQGRVQRFLIDVDGYLLIGNRVFDAKPEMRALFFRAFRVDHDLAALCGVRMRIKNKQQWNELADKLRLLGFGEIKLWIASWVGRIHPLVLLLRALRNSSQRVLARLVDPRLRSIHLKQKKNND